MRKTEQLGKNYKGRMMIGQAGLYRVASELLFRGHVPYIPSVDTGVDLILDNGLKIQVKCRNLQAHPGYPEGAYPFSMKENNKYNNWKARDWAKVCDFLIFWGINENRYFIVPSSEATCNFWIRTADQTRHAVSVSAMQSLRQKGMSYEEIAQQFGVSRQTVSRNLGRPSKYNSPRGNRHLASYEDRWDLLNINQALASVEAASAENIEVI